MHGSVWKLWYFVSNFTKIYSPGSNWQKANIGSGNGSVPKKQQAMILDKYGLVHWLMYGSFGLNKLIIPEEYGQINHTDLFAVETRILQVNYINTMAADDLFSLRCQNISNHGFEYTTKMDPCLPLGRISTNNTIFILRKVRKCKYSFLFPKCIIVERKPPCWFKYDCHMALLLYTGQ